MKDDVQMFSAAWFDHIGISSRQKLTITAWIVVSLLLAAIASILLASPIMAALGMNALLR